MTDGCDDTLVSRPDCYSRRYGNWLVLHFSIMPNIFRICRAVASCQRSTRCYSESRKRRRAEGGGTHIRLSLFGARTRPPLCVVSGNVFCTETIYYFCGEILFYYRKKVIASSEESKYKRVCILSERRREKSYCLRYDLSTYLRAKHTMHAHECNNETKTLLCAKRTKRGRV